MQSKPLTLPVRAVEKDARGCASYEEVANALNSFTEADYAKLMIIAKGFCRSRRLSSSVMDPEELLSEAVARTLRLEKKWVKTVPLLKHLDRAMENISGHLVGPSNKIVPFPDGLSSDGLVTRQFDEESSADLREQQERIQQLLADVFGDDEQARDVFLNRVEGFSVEHTKSEFHLNNTRYESIAKRIRRKIATFLTS